MNEVRWERELSVFDNALLTRMGYDPRRLPTDCNPITEALKTGDLVEKYGDVPGFGRAALSRTAVICQMGIYAATNGPEGDGKPKGLRRQWYAWYKANFAQPAAEQFGDLDDQDQMKDLAWNQRMSTTYADIVDGGRATYRDLWVEDASRMMDAIWERLFRGCSIIVAVEKDSLYGDFVGPAKSLGAASVYSGKGKSSRAGIEKLLREHFGWRPEHDPFSDDRPLIIIHVSDYDFDGQAVIGPTFAQQARRYTPYILEARVGINPEQIEQAEWPDKWLRVKVGNTGYVKWAEEMALFMAECVECGHRWPVQSTKDILAQFEGWGRHHDCPRCSSAVCLEVMVNKEVQDQPYGFEVEAMSSRAYRRLLVRALLEVLPFDHIVQRLREECVASADTAASRIAAEIYAANERYQELLEKYRELEVVKQEFEDEVYGALWDLGEPHRSDWESEEDDPEPEDYEDHVDGGAYGPWRPFSVDVRTGKLVEYVKEELADTIAEFERRHIEF